MTAADCEVCEPPEPRPPRRGNRIHLIAVPGMPFGQGKVIDPEVRVKRSPGGSTGRTVTVRCARLECSCGQVYLETLSKLFRGERKSCGCLRKSGPGRKRAYVKRNKGGYAVTVHLGWFKTRREADSAARRARILVMPESPITGV